MKKIYLLLLSVLSGILLWLSWTPNGFAFLSLIAFIPLFFVSDQLAKNQVKFPFWKGVFYSYFAFFIWNVATTWWIWNSTPEGAVATFVLNSFLMSMVFGFWQRFRKLSLPTFAIPLSFIAFWCSWEFLHLQWDITWPWLNLGNVFASCTQFVQWYEFTGTFGGTFWILSTNFLLFYLLKSCCRSVKIRWIHAIASVVWIALPISASLIRYNTYQLPEVTPKNSIEAVIIQQNTDPFKEYEISNRDHVEHLLEVAKPLLTPQTRIMLCAESAIPHSVISDALLAKDYPEFNTCYSGFLLLDSLTLQYPDLNVVMGISTIRLFDYKATITAKEVQKGLFLDSYNTSVCFNSKGITGMYYKSKLVPGVEKMPYPRIFGFLEKMAIDLGGTTGSLGADSVQRTFELQGTNIPIGVPICYESAYGEHFAKFVNNGARLMAVITNDGWWGNTPGHRQHFMFSKLRAVESRRTILRAANTGISAFIDEKGDAHQSTKYWTQTAIKQNVVPNDTLTFYVKHGDYIARFFVAITTLIFLFGAYLRIKNRIAARKTIHPNLTQPNGNQ